MTGNNRQEGWVPLKRLELNVMVQEMITSGMTRMEIINALREKGLTYDKAEHAYYIALKDMAPSPDFIDDYKRGLIQLNLDRLEKIINETIGGNFQSKAVALKAISEINRMLNVTGNNGVVINKNNKGDEQIIISFGD